MPAKNVGNGFLTAVKRVTAVLVLLGILAGAIASQIVVAGDVEDLKEAAKAQLKWQRRHQEQQAESLAMIEGAFGRIETDIAWLKQAQQKGNGGDR
ncbi:MAG: hypothetical protein ACE5FA_04040 [Dehalococcoidia bacterium]